MGKPNGRAGSEELNTLRLMDALSGSERATQRELSRRAGISLGLTNLLLERMARRAWVKLTSISGRRMIYALTPAGLAEKARKTRDWVRHTYRYFAEAREFLVGELRARGVPRPRVACYGAAELVGLVRDAAHEVGGRLVGLIGPEPGATVAGLPVRSVEDLADMKVDHLVWVEAPPRALAAAWRKEGLSMIDLT
jgi:hypothetical protein